jgi:hypothetical protein
MTDWESKFREWAKPPSDAEQARCERTIKLIREAVQKDPALNQRDVRAFVQGSYRNNTNVRRDSDVDVGVVCYDTFFYDLPDGVAMADFGITPATYHYASFKADLGRALTNYFEPGSVTRGNKAFDIKSSRSQVEADVAAFFPYRRYFSPNHDLKGVELRPDDNSPPRIINWPEQHHDNGVTKNNRTGYRFKSLVRVIKSLRNEMSDAGVDSTRPMIGFLVECLLWNTPDKYLMQDRYDSSVRETLAHLINATSSDQTCGDWCEVSDLKYLFASDQKWSRPQVHLFLWDAWHYVGFN